MRSGEIPWEEGAGLEGFISNHTGSTGSRTTDQKVDDDMGPGQTSSRITNPLRILQSWDESMDVSALIDAPNVSLSVSHDAGS